MPVPHLLNLARETTSKTGTGATIPLDGAAPGALTFAAAAGLASLTPGVTVPYVMENVARTLREWGLATWEVSPARLERTQVLGTTAGTITPIDWPAGTHQVYAPPPPAELAVTKPAIGAGGPIFTIGGAAPNAAGELAAIDNTQLTAKPAGTLMGNLSGSPATPGNESLADVRDALTTETPGPGLAPRADGGGTLAVGWLDAAATLTHVGAAAVVHTHAPADIVGVAGQRLIGRADAAPGPAGEVALGGGLEFAAGSLRRSALTGAVTAAAGDGVTALAAAASRTVLANILGSTAPPAAVGLADFDAALPAEKSLVSDETWGIPAAIIQNVAASTTNAFFGAADDLSAAPFTCDRNCTLTALVCENTNAVTGSAHVAIYEATIAADGSVTLGNRIYLSTDFPTTPAAPQIFSGLSIPLVKGSSYAFALASNNASASFRFLQMAQRAGRLYNGMGSTPSRTPARFVLSASFPPPAVGGLLAVVGSNTSNPPGVRFPVLARWTEV